MAKAKSTEVVDTTSGEIIDPALLAGMEEDAGDRQHFGADYLIVPRIQLAQDLSPQLKPTKAEYIEGLVVGQMFNTVTKEVYAEGFTFVPARFAVVINAWKPRKAGGGLVRQNVDPADVADFEPDGIKQWRTQMAPRPGEEAVTVEVIEAGEWAGIIVTPDGRTSPAIISFPSTKAKVGRSINTIVDMTEVPGKNGPFVPPSYYHQFSFNTAGETNDSGDFWNYVADHMGFVSDVKLMEKAKDLSNKMKSGQAVASEEDAIA